MKPRKLPDWFTDAGYKLPACFPLTVRGDGYCKSFNGRTRWVCGRISPRAAVDRLHERIRDGDFDLTNNRPAPAPDDGHVLADAAEDGLTVKQLANVYLTWLRQRIATGRPQPFSPRTYDDYVVAIQLLLDTVYHDAAGRGVRLASLPAESLGPRHFSAFAARIPGRSPYTHSRYVAAVKAMYRYAGPDENALISRPVAFGSDFKKASVAELDAARSELHKAFGKEELWKVLQAADTDPRWNAICWLGANAAFSNVDIARVAERHFDWSAGEVVLRRQKKGRAWRRCLLWPETIDALRRYLRTGAAQAEADGGLLFTTPTGLPMVRSAERRSEDGDLMRAPRVDALAEGFAQVLARSGIVRKKRGLSSFRTTWRDAAEAMPAKDNDAIDLVMGHRRRHVSKSYVENFPTPKLHAVSDFVKYQLLGGWAMPWPRQTNEPLPRPAGRGDHDLRDRPKTSTSLAA